MLALHGFSLVTFACLAGGVFVHYFKQRTTAARNGTQATARAYFIEHWHETAAQTVCSIVLWLGLPELADLFPDLAASMGIMGEVGVVSSFACGIIGNSFADFLGGRARLVAGK